MIGPTFPDVLKAAAGGDQDAFGKLWHDLQPRLLRYFAVIAPGAAEDLASETWLGVVGGIGRFDGNEPAFRAWVFTIARHEVLDWRRRAARKPRRVQKLVHAARRWYSWRSPLSRSRRCTLLGWPSRTTLRLASGSGGSSPSARWGRWWL
jgi:DNA-directed RNA polymerase specialized sigma24 family protein